ncbi:hypothetical protein KY339_02020, partial [Candidatus Woesearchaeota archaeon]|nr:hypothetical protein [Candidatus Woesearchaeota archaeon]
IQENKQNITRFAELTKKLTIIRSTELAIMAYELGLLDRYLPKLPNPKKQLLEGVLWGLKLNGCAISGREIEKVVGLET